MRDPSKASGGPVSVGGGSPSKSGGSPSKSGGSSGWNGGAADGNSGSEAASRRSLWERADGPLVELELTTQLYGRAVDAGLPDPSALPY